MMQAERRHRPAGLVPAGGDCDAQVLDDPDAKDGVQTMRTTKGGCYPQVEGFTHANDSTSSN